jgi:peptidylprolyl isomerase domain and WD repeat-containing protein 1
MSEATHKRQREPLDEAHANDDANDDDDDVGPMPMAVDDDSVVPRKKRKGGSSDFRRRMQTDKLPTLVLKHEKLFLDHLPSADRYHKSFMHRDVINFVTVTKCVIRYAF